ncbi:toxin YoeB [Algoriphagus alkaliphilus]|uniref:Putative mRNA interferase YoeB n=1 Tax=Algoriphagus alkaliphilus TaxID=279824 RepID=A0A1G5ZPE2_9BACT|nr:Txe/YoeB family addiction module toxin [Algoriphagus alkaliphilus]SDA96718.1 toxin YoeB [Algoriphagus alkaliphilus]
MIFELFFTEKALKGIDRIKKSGNRKLLVKLEKLLDELEEHPYSGTGKPELLKNNYAGLWSRRLNLEHRLIYSIDAQKVTVTLISANGHYTESSR